MNFERENIEAAEEILANMFNRSENIHISYFPQNDGIEIITDNYFNKVTGKHSTCFEISEEILELYLEDFKPKVKNLLTHELNHVKASY